MAGNNRASDVMTESEAAAYLHTTERTLRIWRRVRGLPHFKLTSKVILYRQTELDRWIDRFRVAHREARA